MTIILGCYEGRITIFSRALGKKSREKVFEVHQVEEIKKYVYSWYHRYHGKEEVNLMFSSSMDFPQEYGVTKLQVEQIRKALKIVERVHK